MVGLVSLKKVKVLSREKALPDAQGRDRNPATFVQTAAMERVEKSALAMVARHCGRQKWPVPC
jgi:hypothetical protein